MMESDTDEFDLSRFINDTLCLNDIISSNTQSQFKITKEDYIGKLLEKDPRELLGFNNIGKPRQVAELTIGSPIQEFYRGLNVFVTGGTGFVGKLLIEKLVRCIPHLEQIYVLVRGKRGVSARERFEKLLEDEVFLRMKTEVPDYQRKLTLVEGDISEPELGLSETDRQTLHAQVHVVFHSAADVRFVNSLRAAVNSNLVGSRRVVELAKGMKHLKSYVHVSTAFSNCVRRVIEEKIYKMSVSYHEILKLLQEKSDDEIEKDETRILQAWPNTYTFSKALCEDMLAEEAEGLPLCIFRPSIVGPTYHEPLRGWTDNIYGPVGLFTAAGLGILHVASLDSSVTADWVPADFAVNAMIAVAWENACNRIDKIPVYNYAASPRNPYNWKKIIEITTKWIDTYPLQQAIWYLSFFHPPAFLERVLAFFLHKVPGHVLDWVAVATGRQPRLTKIYNKISLLKGKLDYFVYGTWEFKNENTAQLMSKLSEEDKKLFYCDISDMHIDYFVLSSLGVKYFFLKESIAEESIPEAKRKMLWSEKSNNNESVITSRFHNCKVSSKPKVVERVAAFQLKALASSVAARRRRAARVFNEPALYFNPFNN